MQSAIAVNAESFDVSLLNTSSSAISPRSNDAELDALVGQVAEKTVRQEEKRRDLIEVCLKESNVNFSVSIMFRNILCLLKCLRLITGKIV